MGTLKYLDEFESVENIPAHEVKLYEATTDLILAETVIDSTIYYNKIIKMASEMALYHFPVIFKIRLTPIDANLRQQMRKSVKSASKIITGITGFWNSALKSIELYNQKTHFGRVFQRLKMIHFFIPGLITSSLKLKTNPTCFWVNGFSGKDTR